MKPQSLILVLVASSVGLATYLFLLKSGLVIPSIAKVIYFLVLLMDAHCIYKTMETVILNKGFTSWYQGKLFYQLVRSLIYYWLIMLSYNLLNSFTHTNSYEIFTGVIYALFVAADGLVLWHLSKKNKTFSTDIA